MKLHPGLKAMIKTRALGLRLRFFDTMTDRVALKQATKEELALEPRDWSWWKPLTPRQIKHDAAKLMRQLNTPVPEPPFITRTRAGELPVKKQSLTQRLAAAVSMSTPTSAEPPTPAPTVNVNVNPGVLVYGERSSAAVNLNQDFLDDPRFESSPLKQWLLDQKKTTWR